MSKIFNGNVAIIRNTKGEISLRRCDEGSFSSENVSELLAKMREFARDLKLPISKWALFTPKGGVVPALLVNRFGAPYVALLPRTARAVPKKVGVTRLA